MDNSVSNVTTRFTSTSAVITALLTVAVLASFAWTPRATMTSNIPWKAELAAAIAAVGLSFVLQQRRSATRSQASRWIAQMIFAFILWSLFSVAWAGSGGAAVHHTLVWFIYLAFFIIALHIIESDEAWAIMAAFAIAALILSVSAVLDVATMQDFVVNQGITRIRYGKFAEMAGTFAPVLAAAAIISVRRKWSLIFSAAWLLSLTLVMLSLSKGAFIAAILGNIVALAGCAAVSKMQYRSFSLKLAAAATFFVLAIQLGFSFSSSIPSTSQYISGTADQTRMTSIFRTYVWQVGLEMVRMHPVLGVGADNFGLAVNNSRASLAAKHPEDRAPEIAEDHLVERAHNEPLQILAELGPIGLLIVVLLVGGFGYSSWQAFRKNGFSLPPIYWGSLGGMLAFAASSMVSSFSFRAIQNGIVFFILLALAARSLGGIQDVGAKTSGSWRFIPAIAGLLLILFVGPKAIAEYQVFRAERTDDLETAARLYRSATWLDRDLASAYYALAVRTAEQGNDPASASQYLSEAIDRGMGVTLTYSKLAEYQEKAGDIDGAKATLSKAASIFPNSVFIRVRNAEFLKSIGDQDASAREMAAAVSVDPRQAQGWLTIMTEGSVAAFYHASADTTLAKPSELLPGNAVLEYVDKGQIP